MSNRTERVTFSITPEFKKQIDRRRAEIGAKSGSIPARAEFVRKAVKRRLSNENTCCETRNSTGKN